MVAGVNILRAASRRAALACLLAVVLVWIGTFTLLQIGAPIAVVALLAVAVGTAAVVQSLAPGVGIGLRPARRRGPHGSPADQATRRS